MLRVASADPAPEFLAFVRAWLDMLAEAQLAEACAQLDRPNSYGLTWTAAAIRQLLTDTFGPGTRFGAQHPDGPTFTRTASASGSPRVKIGAFTGGSGYWMDHDVPLNGEWSDLTAQFEFIREPHGFLVVLHDLHVL